MIISLKENKSSRQFLYLYSNNKPTVKRYPESTMDIILWIQITMDNLNISFLVYRRYLVQSLSRVRLFVTPWTAALQISLSITNSQSLLKIMFFELSLTHQTILLQNRSRYRYIKYPLLVWSPWTTGDQTSKS